MSSNVSPSEELNSAEVGSDKQFAYNDGDDAENYLLKVISQAKDISSGSKELESAIRDWPSRYHLSSVRGNLLRGFDFPKGATALEVGAGCGAITRILGEAGLSVTAVEGSIRRSKIAEQRCRDLSGIKVITSNITEFKSTEKFDFVFLIGVLEYAPVFIEDEDPIQKLLSICKSYLKENGILVVAIENRLGLKYLNGAPEDHIGRAYWGIQDLYTKSSPKTFGREELITEFLKAGFSKHSSYYPFPDYKLPEVVINEVALSTPGFFPGELLHQNYSSGNGWSYPVSFDEPLTWSLIGDNKLIADLANSFLIFASEKEIKKEPWLARTFSSRRTITSFSLENNGEISVEKSGRLSVNSEQFQIRTEVAPYVSGRQYQNDLRQILLRGEGVKEIAQWLKSWFELLCDSSTKEKELAESLLPENFIDCVPYNIVVTSNRALEYIDREWVGKEKPPLSWIFIRGVLHSIWRCGWKGPLAGMTYKDAISAIASELSLELTDKHFELADRLEAELISASSGESTKYSSALSLKIENTIQLWQEDIQSQRALENKAGLEIDLRDSRIVDLTRRLEELQRDRDSLYSERESLVQTTTSLREQLESVTIEKDRFQRSSAELSEQNQNLLSELSKVHSQLNQIFTSKSWKMTAPLRKIMEKSSKTTS